MRNSEAIKASVERFVQHMRGAEFSQRDAIFALPHKPESVRRRLRELVAEGKLITRANGPSSEKRYHAARHQRELFELGRFDQLAPCHEAELAFGRMVRMSRAIHD